MWDVDTVIAAPVRMDQFAPSALGFENIDHPQAGGARSIENFFPVAPFFARHEILVEMFDNPRLDGTKREFEAIDGDFFVIGECFEAGSGC